MSIKTLRIRPSVFWVFSESPVVYIVIRSVSNSAQKENFGQQTRWKKVGKLNVKKWNAD